MSEKRGAFRPPRARSREGRPTPSPIPPVPGTRRPAGPGSLTVSAPFLRGPAPAPPGAAHTRGPAAPAPSGRLGSQAAAARAGHGPMDQPAESFLRGKRRDGAGRAGEAGRERAGGGRGEEGERGLRGVLSPPPPRRKLQGRWFQGPAPGLLLTTIIITRRMGSCLGARPRAESTLYNITLFKPSESSCIAVSSPLGR